jgi:hypothetical protein
VTKTATLLGQAPFSYFYGQLYELDPPLPTGESLLYIMADGPEVPETQALPALRTDAMGVPDFDYYGEYGPVHILRAVTPEQTLRDLGYDAIQFPLPEVSA